MRFPWAIGAHFICALLLTPSAIAAGCLEGVGSLGVSRIVEIDTTGGPVFGGITKRTRERSFLGPREVVLTFDDGPMPGLTRSIMDTLDRFCTKATFFSVGKMAIAYPDTVREILRRGHTLGTHTWSHPMNLPRLKGQQAVDQIESGFAAVALAAGQPIAPFFRFPGLNDSDVLVAHLASRGIATFTVDVVSNDSYISDPSRVIDRTLAQLQAENGGIALFHDIKPQTARALPALLSEMKSRGYRIVHLRAKSPFQRDDRYVEAVRQQVAQKNPTAMRSLLAAIDVPAAPAPAVLPPEQTLSTVTATQERPALPTAAEVATAEERVGMAQRSSSGETVQSGVAARESEVQAGISQAGSKPLLKPVRERKVKVAKAFEAKSGPAQVPSSPAVARPPQPQTKPAIEIVAGAYSQAQPRPATSGIAPPEVIAGSYAQQGQPSAAPARKPERSWSDTFQDRQRETGN